ncbi:MAG: lipoyl(octanoyl) transferase LipB [Gammaproteobacteria bacterium]
MKSRIEIPLLRELGRVEYEPTWRAMQQFTETRGPDTRDEIWFLEHPPVFTLGLAGKLEHVLAPGDIPVIHIDRGGQVTYHGPGQLVVYPLIDLKRLKLGVRALVEGIENSVIDTLADLGIEAISKREAPGVYTPDGRKLASLGLRVRRGCTYHGLAFNVAMDLEPFTRINPCGYAGLQMTQVIDLGGPASVAIAAEALKPRLIERLGYNTHSHAPDSAAAVGQS